MSYPSSSTNAARIRLRGTNPSSTSGRSRLRAASPPKRRGGSFALRRRFPEARKPMSTKRVLCRPIMPVSLISSLNSFFDCGAPSRVRRFFYAQGSPRCNRTAAGGWRENTNNPCRIPAGAMRCLGGRLSSSSPEFYPSISPCCCRPCGIFRKAAPRPAPRLLGKPFAGRFPRFRAVRL